MPLSKLSGGEQARVLIARFMLKPADVLLLDEPTNDLDLQSLEVLDSGMQEFSGALVLVTHDRYLLERVSRQMLALDGRGNAHFFADLSQWENWRGKQNEGPANPVVVIDEKKKTLSAKEERELKSVLKKVETDLHAAEKQVQQARLALEDPSIAANAEELARRHEKLDETSQRANALFQQWEELQKIN